MRLNLYLGSHGSFSFQLLLQLLNAALKGKTKPTNVCKSTNYKPGALKPDHLSSSFTFSTPHFHLLPHFLTSYSLTHSLLFLHTIISHLTLLTLCSIQHFTFTTAIDQSCQAPHSVCKHCSETLQTFSIMSAVCL